MSQAYCPPGYPAVMPYLSVEGAERLQDFLVAVFDAAIAESHRNDQGSIVHAAVKIGASIIELSEANEAWGPTPAALHVYVPDVDATHARALEAGATVLHEPRDQEYGERSSAIRDAFGNRWYIATFKG